MNRDEMHCEHVCVCELANYLLFNTYMAYDVYDIFSWFSVSGVAKRWCVWCNLQINVKRLIIFSISYHVWTVRFVLFCSNNTLLSRFGSLSTCYVQCNVLCTRCIPVLPFRLIMLWMLFWQHIFTLYLRVESMIIWFRFWIVYKML